MRQQKIKQSKAKICCELPENSLFFGDLNVVCLKFFKHLNLYVMIKMILILELIFRCEACYCIFANKAAEPYVFFADQTSPTSPTSSAELVEPSKKFGVEKCW